MKLHLPSSLRKALLIVLCTAAGVSFTANGASMSTLVTQTTYCDFGDNAGQYAVHGVNALLQHIRDEDEGVFIYYTKEGMAPYNILVNEGQELISFESRTDQGPAAGIGYNFIATVEHNGRLSATFTGTKIGAGNAIQYASIEYNVSSGNVFCLTPRTDYKIARLSKVITDVSTYNLYTEACSTQDDQMRYRSGSGTFYRVDENNTRVQVGGAYTFNTAGIMKVDSASNYPDYPQVKDYRGIADDSGSILNTTQWWKQADIENGRPLPYAVQPGDSGSPTWLYDTETQTYLYAGAMQSANYTTLSQARYAGQWTQDTMEYFDCTVDAVVGQELHITAVNKAEQGRTSTVNGGAVVTSHPYSGTVTGSAAGTVSFIGVQENSHTWKDLAGVKDNPNWYAYGNSYLAASVEDLFYTNNLVFNAAEAGEYNVVLDATVDTGVGYTRFSRSTVDGYVEFNLSAANNQNYQLDTAGFVVDDGVSLHINLSGESGWVREWRKIGEGDLYLEGSGDNSNILLNLGGSGTTYLQQQGNNCAAYNVLANNGTRVVISDTNQIKKDFTFGYGGATLDMNGNSMTWDNGSGAEAAGFTIHALTDEARIVNGAVDSTVKLTWTQGGTQEYLGSFVESENTGALQFVYAGGDNAKLTLHSIYTNLGSGTGEGGKDGGIIVQSGTLALQGTLTQHAPGSKGVAYSTAAYSNADDWHYADMTAPVKVEGGTFELGSHARLIGDVSVENDGSFIVRESVCHQMEYLEGGYTLKDTDAYRAYFGHHGNVYLNSAESKMEIAFSDTADSTLVYGNSISGRGSLLVNPGVQGGEVHLTGDNSGLTGTRSLVHAGLVFDSKEAVGDLTANQWQVSQSGFIVVNEALLSACGDNALNAVTQDSTGALALTQNSSAFDLSNYQGLYIGAYKDCVVQYGTQGTTDELAAQNGQWRLGGGGGELVVNYVLAGANDLVLGDTLSQGTVRLTNTANSFSGRILFKGGVTLAYDSDDVLGNASFSINYTNRVAPGGGLAKIESDSDGVLLLDPLTKVEEGRRVLDQDLNLTSHSKLAIGSSADMEYRGNISVAKDADYSFGGSTALMTVQNELAVNGTNGLLVDGQTYAGGEIRLEAASQITGAVTVRGCNPEQLPPGAVAGGSITLSLDADNALAQTSSVTIEKGGILDLRGTSQQFKNLEVKAGGALVSSSGAHTGEVSFSMDRNITWNGSSSVGAIRVTGSGTLTLSAADGAHYDELHMGSGTALSLGANNVLSATGTTYIEQGASLATNGYSSDGNIVIRGNMNAEGSSFSGVVTLENGTVSFRKGNLTSEGTLVSHGGTISGFGGSLNGNCHFLENTTTYSAKNISGAMEQGTSTISGNVEISHGATLKLEYASIYYPVPVPITINYEYAISSSEFNTATPAEDEDGRIIPNGTLFADTNVLKLTGGNQNFGGTVKIGNHNTTISNNGGTKTFDNFELTGGTTTVNSSGNVYWTIAHLNGKGTLNANINQQLRLTGEGSFNGALCKTGGSLLLGHESAAANAEVRLDGGASLVLDADKVRVRALGTSGSGTFITANNRNATLEIAPADSSAYTYAGSVSGDTAHGVSLLMSGTGTQTFSGADIKLQNVSVQAGTLAFSNAEQAPVVYGDVSIAQGATLNFGEKTLALASGQVLSIVSGGSGAATFQGNLQFSGGKMLFDSGILSADTAALNHIGTAGLSEGTDALTVNFSNDGLLENQTYLLSSGNWEALSGKIASDSLIYHTATFSATAEGLSVVIGERNDIQVWHGTSAKYNWTSQDFGSEDNRLQAESTAIFNDDAENSNVSITESAQVKEMVFDNKENAYRLVAGTGTTVQADSLRQLGSGSTELVMGSFVIGEAFVEAGSLSLGRGASVGSVSVEEGAAVVLKDTDVVTGSISGDGTVCVDWGDGKTGQVLLESIANLSVESGTVQLDSSARVTRSLAIAEKAAVSMENASASGGGVFLEVDGTLTLTGTQGNVDLTNASGKGTVVLHTTNSYTNKVQVGQGDSFTGTTNLKGGYLNLNQSSFGKTLRVDNNVQMLMHTQVNLATDVVINKDATLHIFQDSSGGVAQLNINGTLTGEGTYNRRGVAPLEVNGEVNLYKFVQENDAARKPVTNFNNAVDLDELVAKSGTIRFNKEVSIGNAVVDGSSVVIGDSAKVFGTMQLKGGNGSVNISKVDGAEAAEINGALTADKEDSAVILTGNGATRLDNASIQLQEVGSQLKMNDLVLGTMSMLEAASSATVSVNNLVIEGQKGINMQPGEAVTIDAERVLRRMGDPDQSMVVEDESFACTFEIGNVQGVELTGDCLTIDISSMYPELKVLSEQYTWLGISLGNGDRVSMLDSDMVVNLKLADELICPAYYLSNVGWGGTKVALAQNGENVGMVFIALYAVPEPATGTLSLLALAALAARRRRK